MLNFNISEKINLIADLQQEVKRLNDKINEFNEDL